MIYERCEACRKADAEKEWREEDRNAYEVHQARQAKVKQWGRLHIAYWYRAMASDAADTKQNEPRKDCAAQRKDWLYQGRDWLFQLADSTTAGPLAYATGAAETSPPDITSTACTLGTSQFTTRFIPASGITHRPAVSPTRRDGPSQQPSSQSWILLLGISTSPEQKQQTSTASTNGPDQKYIVNKNAQD